MDEDKNELKELGSRIAANREKHGMTQQRLSSASGINRSYLAGVESGLRNITMESMKNIADAIGIDPLVLLKGYDEHMPILSAQIGSSGKVFSDILKLYVPSGSTICDPTWGNGVFWRRFVDPKKYNVLASDLSPRKAVGRKIGGFRVKGGIDFRKLPHADDSVDCFVLDPPYKEGLFRGNRKDSVYHKTMGSQYASKAAIKAVEREKGKYHEVSLDLYYSGGKEAYRVLRNKGVMIVKVQDEVSAGKQYLTHCQVVTAYEKIGFRVLDLFVLVNPRIPPLRHNFQKTARKNHSFFLVFQASKKRGGKVKGSASKKR